MPAEGPRPAAVVPAVLTSGHAVKIQKHVDALGLGGAECPIERVLAGDEGRILLQYTITHREADRIDASFGEPFEIVGDDPGFAVFFEAVGGFLFAEFVAQGVFVLGFHACVERGSDPTFQNEPAAQIDAANFFGRAWRFLAEGWRNHCVRQHCYARSGGDFQKVPAIKVVHCWRCYGLAN
jgi:hypothetical protein